MTENILRKTVAICDTQPITAAGLKDLLASSPDLEFLDALKSLEAATEFLQTTTPDIMILDKGFGMRAVLDWIHDLKLADAAPALAVWGVSMTEAEALRLLQAGARGIVRKTARLASVLAFLCTVATRRPWREDGVFPDSIRSQPAARSDMSPRPAQ